MKSIVSFYNFDEVGQNYTDTMVSSYEYSDTVIPLAEFAGTHTAYSVGNNQFMLYEGNEIPKKYLPEFHAGGGAGRPQQRQLCGVYF